MTSARAGEGPGALRGWPVVGKAISQQTRRRAPPSVQPGRQSSVTRLAAPTLSTSPGAPELPLGPRHGHCRCFGWTVVTLAQHVRPAGPDEMAFPAHTLPLPVSPQLVLPRGCCYPPSSFEPRATGQNANIFWSPGWDLGDSMRSEILALRLIDPLWVQRKLRTLEGHRKSICFQFCEEHISWLGR